MTARALFGAIAVEGHKAPYDRLQYKLYYPARLADENNLAQVNMGEVPADAEAAPFPVLIFCPGTNVSPDGYAWLAVQLAEHGIATLLYSWVKEDMPGFVCLSPGLDLDYLRPDSFGSAPCGSALPALLQALGNENQAGVLKGLIDLDNIVIAGHSAGGSVALLNADSNWFPSIKASICYGSHTAAATALGFAEDSHLNMPGTLPVLMIGGNRDGVIAASAFRYSKTQANSSDALSSSNTEEHSSEAATHRLYRSFTESLGAQREESHLVIVHGANHFALVHPQDNTTGRPFLDWPSAEDPKAIRDFLAQIIASFVRKHCRGEQDFHSIVGEHPLVADHQIHRPEAIAV